MILDILVIVIVIQWFNEKRERQKEIANEELEKSRRIEQWKEEIDDYRGWDEKEATYRIVGMIKRLNKHNVTRIDLSRCFLKGANLENANLEGANLFRANLQGASLWSANLEGVTNLTIEQLSKVKTLCLVQNLDPKLRKQIDEERPGLFEQPKKEEIK